MVSIQADLPEGHKLPTYNTVLHILANPVYDGAYVFGRTETRVRLEARRKRMVHGATGANENAGRS